MRSFLLIVALAVFGILGFLFYQNRQKMQVAVRNVSSQEESSNSSKYNFSNPKKSAHYESNTPAHGAVLAGVPINVVIDFNFDLAKPSEIKILGNPSAGSTSSLQAGSGQVDYGEGETIIDSNKLALRRNMQKNAPDGLYTVEYNACWPDKSCHEGNFQFRIDRSKAQNFEDQTGRNEVTVKLSNTKFVPENIRISKGTKVTWVNDDNTDHYINTDSHPAHTYFPQQNSKVLKKGDTFSLVFDKPGIYPYHCSAHEASMKASILVE